MFKTKYVFKFGSSSSQSLSKIFLFEPRADNLTTHYYIEARSRALMQVYKDYVHVAQMRSTVSSIYPQLYPTSRL